MKKILSFLLVLISGICYGQAHEGEVEVEKQVKPAAVLELPYSPNIVNAAMSDYLSKIGKAKGSTVKGFITYRNRF